MSKSGKFVLGALLGAAAAALLTPIAGKKTRQKLQKTVEKVKSDERVNQIIEKGSEIFEKAKDAAGEKINQQTKTKRK
ncbi:YtxH domain-containing protein [Patescibacteria group bacterium]|nr:YtxH domain-containing protein [Patescibacteria group bacterium]